MKYNAIIPIFAPPEINTPVIPWGNIGLLANLALLPTYEPFKYKYGTHIIDRSFFIFMEFVLLR